MTKYYTQYKGIWYAYDPKLDRWWLADHPTKPISVISFPGIKLITECFEVFIKTQSKYIKI